MLADSPLPFEVKIDLISSSIKIQAAHRLDFRFSWVSLSVIINATVWLLWLIHLFSYQLGYNAAGKKHQANNRNDYYALSGHLCR